MSTFVDYKKADNVIFMVGQFKGMHGIIKQEWTSGEFICEVIDQEQNLTIVSTHEICPSFGDNESFANRALSSLDDYR